MFDDEAEQFVQNAIVVKKKGQVFHASRSYQRDMERRAKGVQKTLNELIDRIWRMTNSLNWISGHSSSEGEVLRAGLTPCFAILSGLHSEICRLADKLDRMSPGSEPLFRTYYGDHLEVAYEAIKEGVRITLDEDDDGQSLRAAVLAHSDVVQHRAHLESLVNLRNSHRRKGQKKRDMTEVERFYLEETGKLYDQGKSWDAVRDEFVNTVYETEVGREAVYVVSKSGPRFLEQKHKQFSGFIHVRS